jgi:Cu+-exporting ATPase
MTLTKHKPELVRLSLMALAMLVSWLKVLRVVIEFDVMALTAIIIGGYPMFKEAWENIRRRRMTMELSMSIAVIATLTIGQFFTGLIITFFVIFAELLEHLTEDSGRAVIKKLVDLLPQQAVVRQNNSDMIVDIARLKSGDVVVIKPAAKIPVDGTVLRGNSFVDQSSITGESVPVEKLTGHRVLAGTVNLNNVLEVRVEGAGRETTFGKIIRVIEEAETSQAPIQKTADTLALRLVYFAFGGAIATFLYTHNIVSAISALIVAGACGVAAGTPLAILAAIGRSARAGIIVKGGVYLEQMAGIDTVVLDKTGTLTLGLPEVRRIQPFNHLSEREVLWLAACAEQHSEHPLAGAILKKAGKEGLALEVYDDFKYFPGEGIVCLKGKDEIIVGNIALLKRKSVNGRGEADRFLSRIKSDGETGVIVAKNSELAGIIGLSDVLRPEAREAVRELKKLKTRVVLLSGDSARTAEAIGKSLGVDEALGEMLPHQKADKIRGLVKAGRKVAMIGDGINDAPALVEATVGIAMGAGTDIALESADMALMTNDLTKIVEAIKISRRCMAIIFFNFWGTVLVDLVGVALAFLGHLTPLLGALIHVGSELAFILNSARLFGGKPVAKASVAEK